MAVLLFTAEERMRRLAEQVRSAFATAIQLNFRLQDIMIQDFWHFLL